MIITTIINHSVKDGQRTWGNGIEMANKHIKNSQQYQSAIPQKCELKAQSENTSFIGKVKKQTKKMTL